MTMREALNWAAQMFDNYAFERRYDATWVDTNTRMAKMCRDALTAKDDHSRDYAKGWHAGTEAASVLALKHSERYLENSISRNVLEAIAHGIYAMVMPKLPEQPTPEPLKPGMTWLVSETSYGKVTGWRHFQNLDEALKTAGIWVSQSAGDVTIARRDVAAPMPPAINYDCTHMIMTDRNWRPGYISASATNALPLEDWI